jgi:hypothetical protein
MAQTYQASGDIVNTPNPILEVLAAPLTADWTIEVLAERILSVIASQPGIGPEEFTFDSSTAANRQSQRLIRPLLACLANMSAAEAGTSINIFGGNLSFQRTGPDGPVNITGQFENKQGNVRVELKRFVASQTSQAGSAPLAKVG